jgi:23S rRNA (pseudouridine1915-N3)-methyltransferase
LSFRILRMIRQSVGGLAIRSCAALILERDRTQNRIPLLLIALQPSRFPQNARMRLIVIAIGRLKQGPERELAERYRERIDDIGRKLGFRGLEIHEIPESRARDAATRMSEEATAIAAAIPEKSMLVALDERGENIDSKAFARHLGRWRDEGSSNTIFVIGGADGLSPDLRRKAKLSIAFGSATWPHQMVRVMLLEQLYRAATILAGHPYHRA